MGTFTPAAIHLAGRMAHVPCAPDGAYSTLIYSEIGRTPVPFALRTRQLAPAACHSFSPSSCSCRRITSGSTPNIQKALKPRNVLATDAAGRRARPRSARAQPHRCGSAGTPTCGVQAWRSGTFGGCFSRAPERHRATNFARRERGSSARRPRAVRKLLARRPPRGDLPNGV